MNGSMRGYAVGWTGDWVSGYMGRRMGKWGEWVGIQADGCATGSMGG